MGMHSVLVLVIAGLFHACSEREGRQVTIQRDSSTGKVASHTANISPYLPALPKAYPIDVQNASGQQVKKWLEALMDDDQKYRVMLHQEAYKDDRETSRLMRKQDSLNQVILSLIVQKYGWPSEQTYGRKAAEGAFYVTIHAPYEYKKEYVPLLKVTAERNAGDAKYYRVIQDRILISEGKPQQYNTHRRVSGITHFDLSESDSL